MITIDNVMFVTRLHVIVIMQVTFLWLFVYCGPFSAQLYYLFLIASTQEWFSLDFYQVIKDIGVSNACRKWIFFFFFKRNRFVPKFFCAYFKERKYIKR